MKRKIIQYIGGWVFRDTNRKITIYDNEDGANIRFEKIVPKGIDPKYICKSFIYRDKLQFLEFKMSKEGLMDLHYLIGKYLEYDTKRNSQTTL